MKEIVTIFKWKMLTSVLTTFFKKFKEKISSWKWYIQHIESLKNNFFLHKTYKL